MNTLPQHYRVSDVVILDVSQPLEQIVTHAPLAVFEVLNPGDLWLDVMNRAQQSAATGIPQIWTVDPPSFVKPGVCTARFVGAVPY